MNNIVNKAVSFVQANKATIVEKGIMIVGAILGVVVVKAVTSIPQAYETIRENGETEQTTSDPIQ